MCVSVFTGEEESFPEESENSAAEENDVNERNIRRGIYFF